MNIPDPLALGSWHRAAWAAHPANPKGSAGTEDRIASALSVPTGVGTAIVTRHLRRNV